MGENDYLMQLMKWVGSLDTGQENIRREIASLKEEYLRGRDAAREHATRIEITLEQKVDKEDIGPILTLNNILKSWVGISVLIAIAVGLGILAIGERGEDILKTKYTLERGIDAASKGRTSTK